MTQALNAVGYARVSTDEQATSGLGLDAQRATITQLCASKDWTLLQVADDDGISGGTPVAGRPGLTVALEMIKAGAADVLVVAKLDRLSRSTVHGGQLIEQFQRNGWQLAIADLGLDMSTPVGEMTAGLMFVIGQHERRMISERTKAALAAKKARGDRLGRPASLPARVVARIVDERQHGATYQAIADRLNAEKIPTGQGGDRWYKATIAKILKSHHAHQQHATAADK